MKLTLGSAHELGLCACLTSSMLIVLLGGAFPLWAWLGVCAPLLSLALRRHEIFPPGFSGSLLGLAAVGAGVASLVRGGVQSAIFAGSATLLGVLAARVLTRRTLAHDLQGIMLSLVLVLAGSVLNVGMSYFLIFVAYAISAVWALSTRQLLFGAAQTGAAEGQVRARDDVITPLFFVGSGAVSIAVLSAAIVVFVSFPRIGFGELGFLTGQNSRLPPSVGFGSNPRGLSNSTEIVARVRGVSDQSFDDGLYLRGIVYDEVTLEAFSQSAPDALAAPIIEFIPKLTSLAEDPDRMSTYGVTLNPLAGDLIFSLGHVRLAQTISGGAANPNGSIRIGGRDRHDELKAFRPLSSALRYEVQGSVSAPGVLPRTLPPRSPVLENRERYLKVPTSTGVDALVLEMKLQGLEPRAIVENLRRFFVDNFTYSLAGELEGRERALQAFLLEVRAGHCELFAGAFALLLRKNHIPARVIGGFQGGAVAEDGSIVFQQRHAHAWVEWWSDEHGWIVDDATPEPSASRERLIGLDRILDNLQRFWDDRVVDFSLNDQQDAISKLSSALRGKNLGKISKALAVAVAFAALVVFAWRRLRVSARRGRREDELGTEILRAVVRLQGGEPKPALALLATATMGEAIRGHDHAVLRQALGRYESARFGDVAVADLETRTLIKALRALTNKAGPKA